MASQYFKDTHEQLLRTIIERLEVDILFECFAGLLVQSGKIKLEDIHVIPRDNFRRNYKNDLVPAKEKDEFEKEQFFDEQETNHVTLYTSRSAILDYLPEAFYTQPDNSLEIYDETGRRRQDQEIKKYREQQKEEQEYSRRFFRPIEVMCNQIRIERECDEVRQLENFDQTLELFWDRFAILNEKWRRFVRTLHLVPKIMGDVAKTKALIEYVLGTSVGLEFEIEAFCSIDEAQQEKLDKEEKVMGFNVRLGKKVYDYQEVCLLKIKNLSNAQFYEYFRTGTDDYRLLNEIIKHYFPLNLDVRLNFEIDQEEINGQEKQVIPVIGFSSKLGV